MTFINLVMKLTEVLKEQSGLDDVYEACRTLDMAGAVITALRVLHNNGHLPEVATTKKSEYQSNSYSEKGKISSKRKLYRRALELYNKALLHAPKDSKHLVSAYYNRSLLLYELKAYEECLTDIKTCFQFQCGKELLKKLSNKRKEVEKIISENENFNSNFFNRELAENIFKIKGDIHPEIPCLTADVDVVGESGEMKVVAIKHIPVGTVLGLETAYTTDEQEKSFLRCYYCQKIALNLTPCNNCCYALFCSNTCKKLCLSEYHLIECQIMDVLHTFDNGSRFRLAIKTVLKLKSQCKQWSTLIQESQNIGANRLKISSKKQLCDVNNCSSILSFNDDRHFIHGALFNSCFLYAIVIYHLQKISGFFPRGIKDSLEAQKCLAKLFITLELMWPCATEIYNSAEKMGHDHSKLSSTVPCHYGFFSFTSKLKHACEPNVLLFGLNNQVCLMAIQTIKPTWELKISHIGHWLKHSYTGNERIKKIFQNLFIICNCRVCKEGWNKNNTMKTPLSKFQKTALEKWQQLLNTTEDTVDATIASETCNTLAVLHKHARSKDYQEVFDSFCSQMRVFQLISNNRWIVE